MNWISVEDRLPEETGNYLVYGKPGQIGYIAWAFFDASEQQWCDFNKWEYFKGVTHWQPLPEPPQDYTGIKY